MADTTTPWWQAAISGITSSSAWQATADAVSAVFGWAKQRDAEANTPPIADNKLAREIAAERERLTKDAAKGDLNLDRKDAGA